MIIKYIGFLFTLLWSYTFIKTQSLFKKGSGFLITLFVSNISWLTFIAACFYGLKNFEFYYVLIGIGFIIALVQLTFGRISLFINSKFEDKQNLIRIKTVIEYCIIIAILYYIFALSVLFVPNTSKFLSVITNSPELGTALVTAVIIL